MQKKRNRVAHHVDPLQILHDLRSPLSTLQILTSSLTSIPVEQRELLDRVTSRILQMSQALLVQSKIENNWEYVDLKILITNLLQEKTLEWNSAHVKVSSTVVLKEEIILLPAFELHRILSNLLNNSFQAKRGESIQIHLEVRDSKDGLQFKIADNGSGIPTEVVQKLKSSTISFGKNGSGLGLSHAREKILEWGGDLKISSELGLGTTIELRISR